MDKNKNQCVSVQDLKQLKHVTEFAKMSSNFF